MNQVLKEFNKLKLPIFKELEKVYYGKLDKVNHKEINNIRSYSVCAVGSLRAKFGLPVGESGYDYNCSKCADLAVEFPTKKEQLEYVYDEITSYENQPEYGLEVFRLKQKLKEYQEEYQGLLLDTKRHFRMVHKKELA